MTRIHSKNKIWMMLPSMQQQEHLRIVPNHGKIVIAVAVLLLLFIGACSSDHPGPGPIDVYPPDMIWTTGDIDSSSSEESTTEGMFSCVDFQECAVVCGNLEFGDQTQQLRRECVAECPTPNVSGYEEFFAEWGISCANRVDLCDEGITTCENLVQ